MNIMWRERHPETAIMTKPGLHTWWHQFRLGWSRWRVTTLFDVNMRPDMTIIDVARHFDEALFAAQKDRP